MNFHSLPKFLGTVLIALIITSGISSAAPVCSNLLIETRAGTQLMHRYKQELKKAIYPQLRKRGWTGKKYISVQNMPDANRRVSPQYMIRIDLESRDTKQPRAVLRNKTIQTSLKMESNPIPELNACDLVLSARDSEYLVNQGDVPTPIYVPSITVTQRVTFRKHAK